MLYYHAAGWKATPIQLLFNRLSATLSVCENNACKTHSITFERPLEPYKHFAIFIAEFRRSIRSLGISVIALTIGLFLMSGNLLLFLQQHLNEKLYFFSVAGPFLAHVKVAFFGALYILMPWIMYVVWKGLGRPFGVKGNKLFWFVFSTCFLFYAGTLFCFMITLPYGVSFLLGFQSEDLKAVISVGKFVNFVTIFILAFGVIFELPVFMVFSAGVGVSRTVFEKNRRYAILVIAILAALLTPTPDVVNMALMGGPLYLLYELGILVIRMFKVDEKRRVEQGEDEVDIRAAE